MGQPLKDMTGLKVGKLLVLHRVRNRCAGRTKHLEVWYRVKCDCGRIKSIRGYLLRQNRQISCGCMRGFRNGTSHLPIYKLWIATKSRAKSRGIPFRITLRDLVIPKRCPLLDIPLRRGTLYHKPNSPSIDRKNPRRGYTRKNVWIISHRANAIKNDATLDELKKIVKNLEAAL